MAVEAITTLSSVVAAAGKADGVGSAAKGAGGEHLSVKFSEAMQRIDHVAPGSSQIAGPVKGLFDALDQVNVQARSVSDYAITAEASGGQLTPGEIVQLTMKCQEFMFQCQLTSNIANRGSDGVQQLFRQQG
jgi:hypothetical protein